MENTLSVKNLKVDFETYGGYVQAVRGVSFDVKEGECIAVVGESGCGKSVTAKALMRLISTPPGHIKQGEIFIGNRDILKLSKREMREIRGKEISMIFQDPMTSLNPTMKIGNQIKENLTSHNKMSNEDIKVRLVQMMELVGITNPQKRLNQYPHEFSGGMRQRVMIAMAMICNPKILIADEPTTALDVTIQAQILNLMKEIKDRFKTSIILITHDMGVVANMANRILVFYAGKIVESGEPDDIFYNSKHPYTFALLKSMPRLDLDEKSDLTVIEGVPPDLFSPPKGCAFAPRCGYSMKICNLKEPPLMEIKRGHSAACFLNHEKAKKRMGGL